MGLDVMLTRIQLTTVYSANITHNLREMASEAGIYLDLWRPEEIGIKYARQLISPLRDGIALMKSDPERFKKFDSPNEWGTYEQFMPWIHEYLEACEQYPDAEIEVNR